ncbi:hypothetical protein [Mycolicibacterium palauense]|uniref:hypothetical protein n=1 Tax=Mycolicibacterium palauense TaxID=2034511 RepID=UPI001145EBBD|nr:hypothetical protein [Mycolicibacterium palauense]
MRTFGSPGEYWDDKARENEERAAAEAARAAAARTLNTSDDPIEVFNAFVTLRTDPSLHAHFADSDDNDAESVRRAIRRALGRPDG